MQGMLLLINKKREKYGVLCGGYFVCDYMECTVSLFKPIVFILLTSKIY